MQLINAAYAMFHARGIKIKKAGFAGKVGFERAVDSCEWSKVEKASLENISIQLEAIRKEREVLDAGNYRSCRNASGL